MLSTPPEFWWQRVEADRRSSELYFRGKPYTFAELSDLRAGEGLEREVTPEVMQCRHSACQIAIAALGQVVADAAPDVAVIIGDDQQEIFSDDNMPAFSVYWGESVRNVPLTEEQKTKRPPGLTIAEWGHTPPEAVSCPTEAGLGRHLIDCLIEREFDVAHSRELPGGRFGNHSIPHAYGFFYRRIMNDQVIPNVPVFVNTFYPPNQPSIKRCYDFGTALGHAVLSWPEARTVAIMASGGLSHFVVEEDLDHEILDGLLHKDQARLQAIPASRFESGTSEIRNWLVLAGAMAVTGLSMHLIDYQPCYRAAAGTGNAMGFAYWS